MSLVSPLFQEAADAVDIQALGPIRIDGQPQGRQSGQRFGLARNGRAALRPVLEELVGPGREPPGRRHPRVLLPQGAGPAVPRIGIVRQAGFLALGVDPGEFRLGHVDLAPNLGGHRFAKPFRQRLDGPQIGRHVFARCAVATSRALNEPTLLVAQGDRQAVDLQLGHVTQLWCPFGRGWQTEPAADALVEGAQLVLVEDIAQRQHRSPVRHFAEGAGRGGANALGR